jgi:general stress protein 26
MDRADNAHVFAEKIAGIATAMLTTRTREGRLTSRPMVAPPFDFDGSLWFFTRASSETAEEISLDQDVCVTFADPASQRYVAAVGRASIVNDRDKARALWTPELMPWLNGGVDDPELRLVKVEVERADFWEPPGVLVHLVGFVKSAVPTDRPAGWSQPGAAAL